MRLLLTGGNSPLARAVIETLSADTVIRALDCRFDAPLPARVEAHEGDLRDRAFVETRLPQTDAILHLAPLYPTGTDDSDTLDQAARGTYVLTTAAADAGVRRLVLGSALALFDRLPAHWKIDEEWRPRPEPVPMQLAPWLAELSARECARALPLQIQCLRFGQIVNTAEAAAQPYDPRWLHIEDAVAAIQCALRREPRPDRERDWQIFHIAAAGDRAKVRLVGARRETFGYQPQHDFRDRWPAAPEETAGDARPWQEILAPPQPIPSRPIQKVVIFGAGGPLGAALTQELKNDYILRLTDLRPLAEIAAEGKPQSEGAPLPVPLEPPHENRVVDVRDAAQVLAACEGMDAIINCSVLRHDPTDAFLVNMLGAYHMALGAAQHRIRRLVQTGPQLVTLHDENDYSWDYDVPGDPPERPGRHLYGHSKYLGQEILRVFADHYGLEVPVLLFTAFINPKFAHWFHPMIVTWEDSARALRGALETTALPSPYEVMHITTDLPHGRYSNRKAKTLLGWQPQDLLESLWK